MNGMAKQVKETGMMKKLHRYSFTLIPAASAAVVLFALNRIYRSGIGEEYLVAAGVFGLLILILSIFILLGNRLHR